MEIWLITLIAMWINPILGYLLVRFSKKGSRQRHLLVLFFTSVTLIEIIGISTNVSFKSSIADFIFVSIFYLGICFGIWVLTFNKKSIIRILGIVFAVLIFGLNYLSSTIGILGVGFILNDWDPSKEIKLGDNLEYKEIPLGMATSDYRGKRIEIYKQNNLLPFERKILVQEYINEAPSLFNKIDVQYNSETKELFLFGADTLINNKIEYWNDTIKIE